MLDGFKKNPDQLGGLETADETYARVINFKNDLYVSENIHSVETFKGKQIAIVSHSNLGIVLTADWPIKGPNLLRRS